MLHLLADSSPETRPYAEAVARLASVRHALRLVEPFGAGPASDIDRDAAIDAEWDDAGEARRRRFDRRSEQIVAATAAGVEVLLAERQQDREPNPLASRELVEQIRRELAELAHIILD